MKKYVLFINKFAEKDLENAQNYYNEQKEGLGTEFLMEVKGAVKIIEENPFQFQKVEKEARKANIGRFPYCILYIVNELTINVFSVIHFSRNPEIWKKRIDKK